MSETVFYENGDVRVTNARFIVGNQTHAMSGVTSVASTVADPNRGGLIVGLLVGLAMLIWGNGGWAIFGLLVAAGCAFGLYNQKATHAVVLRSSSGEVRALAGTDEEHIRGVVAALNEALVHRG